MKLYEYLIGGKKHNIPDTKLYKSKSFKNIEKGDHLMLWNFDRNFNLKRKISWKVEEIEQAKFFRKFIGPVQIVYKGDDDYLSKTLQPTIKNEDLDKNLTAWKSDTGSFCAITSFDDEEQVKKQVKIELIWQL